MEPYTAKTHTIDFSYEKKHVYCPYRCLYVISCWHAIFKKKDHARETPTSASPTLPKPSNGTWILRAIRVDWFDCSFGTINVEESLIHLGGFGQKHEKHGSFFAFFFEGGTAGYSKIWRKTVGYFNLSTCSSEYIFSIRCMLGASKDFFGRLIVRSEPLWFKMVQKVS